MTDLAIFTITYIGVALGGSRGWSSIGSIANLIVIEQAANHGIKIIFRQHAAVSLPVTLVSLVVLILWMFI